jgi:hypothetical protein
LPTPPSATYDPPQPLFQYPCDANASGYTASSAYQNTPTISSSRINSASNGNLSQQSQRLLPKGGKNRVTNSLFTLQFKIVLIIFIFDRMQTYCRLFCVSSKNWIMRVLKWLTLLFIVEWKRWKTNEQYINLTIN